MTNWDYVRTLILGQATSIAFVTCVILYRYTKINFYKKYYDIRFPLHIFFLAVSYLISIGFICGSLLSRLGEPYSWRIIVAETVLLTGIVGLFFMSNKLKLQLGTSRKKY